ncbi:MAG: rane protein [Marmoricola sp.]|nr:rane protein [Marmoricola sp.]
MAAPPPESTGRGTAVDHYQASRHDPVYDRLAQTAEFAELRRRYRGFAFPATAAFLAWYLLYVVLSNWATGFMGHKLFGNINVALVFGLLQFATTFILAWVYSNYSTRKLDPLARQLNEDYEKNRNNRGDV